MDDSIRANLLLKQEKTAQIVDRLAGDLKRDTAALQDFVNALQSGGEGVLFSGGSINNGRTGRDIITAVIPFDEIPTKEGIGQTIQDLRQARRDLQDIKSQLQTQRF